MGVLSLKLGMALTSMQTINSKTGFAIIESTGNHTVTKTVAKPDSIKYK